MNPLISKITTNNCSQYFIELQKLSKSSEKDVNKRIIAIFREHSDSLVADLVANPDHRKSYREIGASLRQNDNLQAFQSSIGYIQKLARLVEENDREGLEKLSNQLSNDSSVLVQFSPALEKLLHLKLPDNIEDIRGSVEPNLKVPLLAAIIDRDKLPINGLGLSKQELIEVAPHLTYLNCKDAFDDSWTEKDIYSLLDSCKQLKILKINSPLITSLPPLSSCEIIDSSECVNLDPLENIYQKIYESLGEEFIELLREGKVYLNREKILSKESTINEHSENVKIHLRPFQNSNISSLSDTQKSSQIAKEMIARKFLEFSGKSNQKTVHNPSLRLEFSEKQKQEFLFEIIKIAATENLHQLSDYNILSLDQDKRFEILKIAVKSHKSFVILNIKNYHLTEKQRFEIAQIAALEIDSIESLESYFSIYDITDLNFRFELTKIIAARGVDIFDIIKNYPFTEQQRFEIAKILATKPRYFSTTIQDFDLTKSQRFEIAKIVAFHQPVELMLNISRYDLTEDQRFDVAKIIIDNMESADFIPFESYAIQDPSKHFELIKRLAAKGFHVSATIKKCSLTKNQLYEIAKITAAKNVEFSKFIKNYKLTEDQRYEILHIAASNFGGLISKYINLYEISDQNKRFEIAKIATEKNVATISKNLNRFDLTKDQELQIIHHALFQCFSSNNENSRSLKGFESVKSILGDYQIEDRDVHFPAFRLLELASTDLTDSELKEIAQRCPYYHDIAFILENISAYKEHKIRQPLIECLGALLLVCHIINISEQTLGRIKPLIDELFDLRAPDLRMNLIDSLVQIIKSENEINNFENLFKLAENKSDKESHKTFTALTCMILGPYIVEEDKAELANAIKNRKIFQNSNERIPFLRNLERILKEPSLSQSDKRAILQNLILEKPITPKSLIKNSEYACCLLNFDKGGFLKGALRTKGLDAIINSMFEEKLKLKSIENVGDKFMSTFGSFKKKELLFQYAATLMSLEGYERDIHMDSLREFVTSVLEGNFREVRYSTENNLHLQTVFSGEEGEELKRLWVKGAKYENIFLEKNVHEKREYNFYELLSLQDKIAFENRLDTIDKHDFDDLKVVLIDSHNLPEIREKLENVLHDETIDFRFKRIASFQLQVMRLMLSPPLKSHEMEEKIKILMKTLKSIYINQEPPLFFQDLEEALKKLEAPISRLANRYEGYAILDTDNPEHLLNIAEGVLSCQSVTNAAKYSKCLLSYILDGKNRAMLIVDKDGNMIARAIIRLLWDPVENKTILFQERSYANTTDPLITSALDKACKKRAEELGLILLNSMDSVGSSHYPNPIHSLDGRAPSEYVDSAPSKSRVSGNVWSHTNAYYVK